MTNLSLSIGQATKRGPRERNEDAVAISPCHDFFAIADGIGGAPLGDVASTLTCNAALLAYEETLDLHKAFARANLALIQLKKLLWTHNPITGNLAPLATTARSRNVKGDETKAESKAEGPTPKGTDQNGWHEGAASIRRQDESATHAGTSGATRLSASSGTGCTLLLAERSDSKLSLAWAGDTVALLLRDEKLQFIAQPDNVGATNELASAVGYSENLAPLQACCDILPRDRFLLCTDGVWSTIAPERLTELLATPAHAPWLAELVTKEAAEQGHDNATAIVIVAEEERPREPRTTDSAAEGALEVPCVPCTPSYPLINYT